MGYVTNKTALTTYLETTYGYQEVENVLEIEDAPEIGTKLYSLKPIGIDLNDLTSNSSLNTHILELKTRYINYDASKTMNEARDSNFDLFITLVQNLKSLDDFVGFADTEASFEDLDNDRMISIGTIKFHFGIATS